VDHAALARRTRRRVVSGGREIGRQVTALGRGATCRRVLAATTRSRWSMPWRCGRGGDSRVGLRMDAGAAAIREESDKDFLF
jgi:hypothetical protein